MTVSGSGVRLVFVTGPDPEELRAIGRALVEERLVACVNVLAGVTSVYRWEGRVEEEGEALALLKTTEDRLEEAERRLTSLHPYDEPEFLAVPVGEGAASYLDWVAASVRPIHRA